MRFSGGTTCHRSSHDSQHLPAPRPYVWYTCDAGIWCSFNYITCGVHVQSSIRLQCTSCCCWCVTTFPFHSLPTGLIVWWLLNDFLPFTFTHTQGRCFLCTLVLLYVSSCVWLHWEEKFSSSLNLYFVVNLMQLKLCSSVTMINS